MQAERSSATRIPFLPLRTSTRWATARIIPWTAGPSVRSTVLPMRRSPSERSVSRWLWFVPAALRRWVI